jgi:hypothetical protein
MQRTNESIYRLRTRLRKDRNRRARLIRGSKWRVVHLYHREWGHLPYCAFCDVKATLLGGGEGPSSACM